MKMLFEVVRWNRLLRTGDRGFKLRNEAEPCPVPGCTRPVTVAASLCDEHWAAVPQRLRQELRRRERAWREGRPRTSWTK